MKIEMTKREANDFMRACTHIMLDFRADARLAKTPEQKEIALRNERMWKARHDLILKAILDAEKFHQE